jgi:hypothetical protein
VWIKLNHAHVLTLHGTVSGFGQLPALVSKWMHNGALDGYLERTSLTMEQKLNLVRFIVSNICRTLLNGFPFLGETGGGWLEISYGIAVLNSRFLSDKLFSS